jgi:hypothetical protein
VTNADKQWYVVTRDQLFQLSGQRAYGAVASAAVEQVQTADALGHQSTVYFSRFNGFRVIDESDPEQFRVGLAIGARAKPFSM